MYLLFLSIEHYIFFFFGKTGEMHYAYPQTAGMGLCETHSLKSLHDILRLLVDESVLSILPGHSSQT